MALVAAVVLRLLWRWFAVVDLFMMVVLKGNDKNVPEMEGVGDFFWRW
jgi:hypothetical protein